MQSRRILIVEDEQDTAELLIYVLGSDSYHVEHAANGEIALAMLMDQHWDLVLTDLMMPVLDGAELVKEMRAKPELAAVPALMLTSTPEHLARLMLEHPTAFLQKPIQARQLIRCVDRLLADPHREAFGDRWSERDPVGVAKTNAELTRDLA